MKAFLVLLAVLALVWLINGSRRRRQAPTTRPVDPPRAEQSLQTPQAPMRACAQCGVYLPFDDALPGRGGSFCSEAHRAAYEKAHPS